MLTTAMTKQPFARARLAAATVKGVAPEAATPPARRPRPQTSAWAAPSASSSSASASVFEHRGPATGDQVNEPVLRHAEGGGKLGAILHGDADRGAGPGIDEPPPAFNRCAMTVAAPEMSGMARRTAAMARSCPSASASRMRALSHVSMPA